MVGLTQFLPMLAMTLPAGHLADTRNRKAIIMSSLGVMGAALLGLALVAWKWEGIAWTHGQVYLVYGCLLLSGVARTFNWSASALSAAIGLAPGISAGRESELRHVSIAAVAGPAAEGR